MKPNHTVVFPEPHEVTIEEREKPEPAPDQVLIETETSLVSTGTELTILSGEFPTGSAWSEYGEYPFVPGYNNIGTIVECGKDIDREEVGKTVATWNPHARYTVADYEDCVLVPDNISTRDASLFSTAQIAMNGLRRGRVTWGESVAIYGLGIVGQLTARFCRAAGTRRIFGLDISSSRLEYFPETPESYRVDAKNDDVARTVKDSNGRLVDVVFEVTGNSDAITDEFRILKEQGRFVVLSSPKGETSFDFHDFCNQPSYEIIGAHQTSHPPVETPRNPWTKDRHAKLYFDFLQHERIRVADLHSHETSYKEAPSLYETLLADRSQTMAVCLDW